MSQKIRIHEIRSIEEVYKYIDKTMDPFIFIDIDETVFKVKWNDIDPNEYFRDNLLDGFKYNYFRQDFKGNFASYCNPLYRGIVRNFNWIAEHPEAKYKLVEGETTCKVIKDLQKNYQTSFITARGLELHKVTEKNLRKHGLIRGKYDTDFKIPLSFLEAGIRSSIDLYYLGNEGIIFTAGRSKGKILDSYFVPGSSKSLVLMIDDSLGALQSVGEFFEKYDIPFIGLHYKPILNKRGSRYNTAKQREKRYKALAELAEQTQELDMGYGGVQINDDAKKYLDKNNITITHGIKPPYYTTHVSLTPSIEKPFTLDDAIQAFKQPVIKSTKGKRPMELMPAEWWSYGLSSFQTGIEKGYTPGSWKKPFSTSKWAAAATRHLQDFLTGGGKGYDGTYTEYKSDGTPCESPANHLDNAIWNLKRIKWGLIHTPEEDDRDGD